MRAHVAAALHVVLPAEGVEARAQRPTWPVSSARLMSASTLSTALWCSVMPRVQHSWARVRLGVRVRELADRRRRDAGDLLAALERPRLDRGRVLVEPVGRALDEVVCTRPAG